MKIKFLLLTSLILFLLSSCRMGLDELPAYEEANITSLSFEYRWEDEATHLFNVVQLTNKDLSIDEDNGVIEVSLEVPAADDKFPEAVRQMVTLDKLVLVSSISTAAIIEPIEGAPQMGTMGSFTSKTVKYLVTSASGNEKVWTIKINEFIK